ncbi:MAG: T9SS type A sorting domain-containing protein [FCB group bacterium]|nr:T9SS type A sorting domain-containing protein [FCB group bacterium]MBL7027323.1 T9SS type A sorting domain-containing protein [Candidatus Neomarinimicrobiota bacterium]MBL7122293.1 T9SS type A sorting domain-containing protein [Candidatus Neomarinimicrobiota bacterium]
MNYRIRMQALTLLLFLNFISAQDYNTTLIDHWGSGPCYAIAVEDSLSFMSSGSVFHVVDIRTPESPVLLNSLTFSSQIMEIAISGDLAYIAAGWAGLRIVDISDPNNLVELSPYFTPGIDLGTVDIYDNYAFIGFYNGGYEILDISDPNNLVTVYFSEDFWTRGFVFQEGFAYSVGSWIRILDISDISAPLDRGVFDLPRFTEGIDINGDYLYIAGPLLGLHIFNIANPDTILDLGGIYTGNSTRKVAVRGSFAYLAEHEEGLSVVDISIPTSPTLGASDAIGTAWSITIQDSLMHLGAGEEGLRLIDISNPTNPTEIGYFDSGAKSQDLVIRDELIYLANSFDGLTILDFSDSANISPISSLDTDGDVSGLDLSGDLAFLADEIRGLVAVDISNSLAPLEVGCLPSSGHPVAVTIQNNYAYVAQLSGGLLIVDIGDPANMVEVGHSLFLESVYSLDIKGSLLIVGLENAYKIIDVSDPTAPMTLNTSYIDRILDIDIEADLAYMAAERSGVRIVDFSDPENPFEVGFFDNDDYFSRVYGVQVDRGFAYLAEYLNGLRIVDISDPANAFETGYYNTGAAAVKVATWDRYAYVADRNDGVYVIQNDLVQESFWIDSLEALPGDTICVNVHSGLFSYTNFSACEIVFGGFLQSLEFVDVELGSSFLDTTNLLVEITYPGSFMQINLSGSEEYQGSGILLGLVFVVPESLASATIPITIESVLFDGADLLLETSNGVVSVLTPPAYGDVDWNGVIDYGDAELILNYLVGEVELDSLQLSVADVNLDQLVTAWDASLVYQFSDSVFLALPVDDSGPAFQASGDLSANDMAGVEPGSYLELPIYLNDANNILSFGGSIAYNSAMLGVLNGGFIWPESLSGFSFSSRVSNGLIQFAAASSVPMIADSLFTSLFFVVNHNFTPDSVTSVTLELLGFNGNTAFPPLEITFTGVVGLGSKIKYPDSFSLDQNYPNPFNPRTSICYTLPESSPVSLTITNIRGQQVKTFPHDLQTAGNHEVQWLGLDDLGDRVSSGVYFCRMSASGYIQTIKMVYLQ